MNKIDKLSVVAGVTGAVLLAGAAVNHETDQSLAEIRDSKVGQKARYEFGERAKDIYSCTIVGAKAVEGVIKDEAGLERSRLDVTFERTTNQALISALDNDYDTKVSQRSVGEVVGDEVAGMPFPSMRFVTALVERPWANNQSEPDATVAPPLRNGDTVTVTRRYNPIVLSQFADAPHIEATTEISTVTLKAETTFDVRLEERRHEDMPEDPNTQIGYVESARITGKCGGRLELTYKNGVLAGAKAIHQMRA